MLDEWDDLAFGPLFVDETGDGYLLIGEEVGWWFFARCELARAAGGISEADRVDGLRVPPDGWWLDRESMHWLPPEFRFGSGVVQ